uniref:NADH-ubiquinone oxidoreductase chain 3 n=1 Tax=Empoascanara angkhangica TaxID=3057149 RepID=A0AA51NHI5_9HEMI|nr:NADH dehydrogenase subunit 3 [Empoascanara angkhangica]WMQ52406.1 NADH dehydrogenase subunit 3 [Empoascanara angkhangica]
MNLILFHLLTVTLINMIIIFMIMFIAKKPIFDLQKSTPFECGFNPMTFKRLPFSIHFFLIAVIFLIFDIEIIIIMPMILTIKSAQMMAWLLTSFIFIMILIIGLYHEWINGMLNWTK